LQVDSVLIASMATPINDREAINIQVERIRAENFKRENKLSAEEESVRAKQLVIALNVAAIKTIVPVFFEWVNTNNVPCNLKNKLPYDRRTRFQKLIQKDSEYYSEGFTGWLLATHDVCVPFMDTSTEVECRLAISENGNLGYSHSDSWGSGYSLEVSDKELGIFQPSDIHLKIAELCVQYELKWGTPN